MSQLLLLNPRKRRARKAGAKRRRSPAQRAATARMLAANRSRGRVARNPARRRRVTYHRRAALRHNPIRRARRSSYRRNPISGNVTAMLKVGAIGGVGAVGVDIIFGYLAPMLPASMSTPVNATTGGTNWLYFAAKGAVAIGIGTYGGKLMKPQTAEAIAVGALTIMAYQIARSLVPASVTMGAYVNPGRVMRPGPMSGAMTNNMGAYLPRSAPQPGANVSNMRAPMMAR